MSLLMTIMAPINPPGCSDSSYSYKLPFELERAICEMAVSKFPRCIPNIVLVCHRFRIWFEPELYRIIRYVDGSVLSPFYLPGDPTCNKVLDMSRIREFGPHVQHLLLCWKGTPEEAYAILTCCPNIINLSLWFMSSPVSCAHLVPLLEKLPLRELEFQPSDFFPDLNSPVDASFPPKSPATFRNITHLKMALEGKRSWWTRWKRLVHLPKLTHLALSGIGADVEDDHIHFALEECRHLELLVSNLFQPGMYHGNPKLEIVHRLDGYEIVVIRSRSFLLSNSVYNWENCARGDDDSWRRVQEQKEEAIREHLRALGYSSGEVDNRVDNIKAGIFCVMNLSYL